MKDLKPVVDEKLTLEQAKASELGPERVSALFNHTDLDDLMHSSVAGFNRVSGIQLSAKELLAVSSSPMVDDYALESSLNALGIAYNSMISPEELY